MSEFAIILPAAPAADLHRTLSSLVFQKEKDFQVYLVQSPGTSEAVTGFEDRLPLKWVDIASGGGAFSALAAVKDEPFVCFLTPEVDLAPKSLRRMRRCIDGHPGHDVYHWNLAAPARKYGLKTAPARLFKEVFFKGGVAPLSSFVFRRSALAVWLASAPSAADSALAAVLACAGEQGIRTARWERLGWHRPAPAADPAALEREVRANLAFFRWTESFFGNAYPVGVGDRLDLFATEAARLYPSYTADELKALMQEFAVVDGPVRKLRASSALKGALKRRKETLL